MGREKLGGGYVTVIVKRIALGEGDGLWVIWDRDILQFFLTGLVLFGAPAGGRASPSMSALFRKFTPSTSCWSPSFTPLRIPYT